MKAALLIIDMLNDYLDPNGANYSPNGRKIIPNIATLKKYFVDNECPVIYVNTSHINAGDPETAKWGVQAVRGSWGAEVVPELKMTLNDIEVFKRTYDGFYNTELEITLRSLDIDTVVVCGIHTHVCVLCTALGAFYRGYNVYALEDCMTTNRIENHESRLRFYNTHIGTLTTLDEFITHDFLGKESH